MIGAFLPRLNALLQQTMAKAQQARAAQMQQQPPGAPMGQQPMPQPPGAQPGPPQGAPMIPH